jgi:hypothetical protein
MDNGIASYNVLQTEFRKSTSKNLSFLATCTEPHALDDGCPRSTITTGNPPIAYAWSLKMELAAA